MLEIVQQTYLDYYNAAFLLLYKIKLIFPIAYAIVICLVDALRILTEKDILILLEADKETYLRQMNTYKELGSADSFNASLANDYGINVVGTNPIPQTLIKYSCIIPYNAL